LQPVVNYKPIFNMVTAWYNHSEEQATQLRMCFDLINNYITGEMFTI